MTTKRWCLTGNLQIASDLLSSVKKCSFRQFRGAKRPLSRPPSYFEFCAYPFTSCLTTLLSVLFVIVLFLFCFDSSVTQIGISGVAGLAVGFQCDFDGFCTLLVYVPMYILMAFRAAVWTKLVLLKKIRLFRCGERDFSPAKNFPLASLCNNQLSGFERRLLRRHYTDLHPRRFSPGDITGS